MKVNQTVDEEMRKNTNLYENSMQSSMPTFLAHYDENIKNDSPRAKFVDLLENGSLIVQEVDSEDELELPRYCSPVERQSHAQSFKKSGRAQSIVEICQ